MCVWVSKERVGIFTAQISLLTIQFRVNFFVKENAAIISNGRGAPVQMLHKVFDKKCSRKECSSSSPGFGIDSTGSHTCASYLSSLQILVTLSVQLSGLEVSGLISCSRVVFISPSQSCSLRTPWALVLVVGFCI